ncbi:MAG: malto-oligosyltrehalose trehalohydrolase [Thermoproteota archaeon]
MFEMRLGANYLGDEECRFVVWAPLLEDVKVKQVSPQKRMIPMEKGEWGCWRGVGNQIPPGTRYFYELEGGKKRPDPASDFQPQGVHGPSEVVNHDNFQWSDCNWEGIPLEEMIIYELHVGTFTPPGTFKAITTKLDDLRELGVNSIEIMPVGQFPGKRNWGYDGVQIFAPQNTYGGPWEMKKLIDACHSQGISVILDVVYNHLGPEGNYLEDFAPYFTEKYRTPWGSAINFDDAYSDGVRNFFIENALHWFRNYHVDALRLDALHAIYDRRANPFLRELAQSVEEFSLRKEREFYLIGESDLNDAKLVTSPDLNGYGLSAQWCGDFHHSLHTLLTGEKVGYYLDFGKIEHLGKAWKEGFVYSGQYSQYRKRRHGNSSKDIPAKKFVVFSQNHDQVGNRMLGERLSQIVSFQALKLAAGVTILSPYIPLLFMGEEYGEESSFLYFVSYSEPELIEAVRKGRREEFKDFEWKGEPPDTQRPQTFNESKLHWDARKVGRHKILLNFYHRLIKLRKEDPVLSNLNKGNLEVSEVEDKRIIFIRRWLGKEEIFYIMSFNNRKITVNVYLEGGEWTKIIDSSQKKWRGPGSTFPQRIEERQKLTVPPYSFALYKRK